MSRKEMREEIARLERFEKGTFDRSIWNAEQVKRRLKQLARLRWSIQSQSLAKQFARLSSKVSHGRSFQEQLQVLAA